MQGQPFVGSNHVVAEPVDMLELAQDMMGVMCTPSECCCFSRLARDVCSDRGAMCELQARPDQGALRPRPDEKCLESGPQSTKQHLKEGGGRTGAQEDAEGEPGSVK